MKSLRGNISVDNNIRTAAMGAGSEDEFVIVPRRDNSSVGNNFWVTAMNHEDPKNWRAKAEIAILPELGPALRRRRKAARLTMSQLADECGLSQPFLSQIENSKAMPSLLALHRVAQALDTTTVALLEPVNSALTLVRHNEGERFVLTDGATTRFLTPGDGHRLEANETIAAPGAAMPVAIVHEGQEMIMVLDGQLNIHLEGQEPVVLEVGDTMSYPATTPHRWSSGNLGARFLIVSSPPSF